jgi:hypothetical protein
VEAAYTQYEGSGTTKYLNASGDSVFRNTNESVGLPKNDGSIIDVNIGAAFEKSVRQLTLYGAAVFNYARNKSEQSNNGTNVSRFGTQQPVTTTFAQTYAATVNWWFVRLPLGAEYAFTKGLAFRGGIMPEYLSTTTENSSERTQSSTQGTVYKTTNESTTKNLRFTATLGASLYDDELGEMHASYGTTRGMGNSWSVSLRFYP